MKKATESEKQLVRELAEKISDLRMIIKCEPVIERPQEKIRERIGYVKNDFSPNGENEDYVFRNMSELTKPNPKPRIPNR